MLDFRFLVLILFLSLGYLHSNAQFNETFDDGDFTDNPSWQGDQDVFIVNALSALQLNDIDVSKSEAYLSVNAPTGLNATWKFSTTLEFSPSTSNFCRIYLNSDQPILTGSLQGYYIQLGGISGNEDAVELIRQTGNATEVILSGTAGKAATEPLQVDVEVSRDAQGQWTLLVDYQDGLGLIDEGSVIDTQIVQGKFFGLVCNYTSSRNDAFSFDNISIDPIVVDETAPVLESTRPLDNSTVELVFDEEIDFDNLSATNFQIDNGISVVSVDAGTSANALVLNVAPNLVDMTTYVLNVLNISDAVGNILSSAESSFTFQEVFSAQEYDILINEFMADPTPQVGLPNAEYIELYNNSDVNFQLSDYTLASGGNPVTLPEFILGAKEYVLITKTDELTNFQIFGAAVGLSSFPGLSNDGDEILLQSLDGAIIHRVNYDLDWYQDGVKEEGGYSIELINPLHACKGQANYTASTNLSGGTPSNPNAVFDNTEDTSGPELTSIFTIDPSTILLAFDEPLADIEAEEVFHYMLSDQLEVVAALLQADETQVSLSLSNPLEVGQLYSLQYENIADCLGNTSMRSDSVFFSLPQQPQVGDLLINEILFNPLSGGVDYVEFYNPTDRVFNLADLQMGNLIEDVNTIESIAMDHLILPSTYVCLTPDKSDILSRFPLEDPSTIFENPLPRFDDKSGKVALISLDGLNPIFIDEFEYSEDYHTGFIADKNGVSLERISFSSNTNDPSNWTSGAESTGFGTPGYENAQVIANPTINSSDFFEIINPTFSPDQDGFKDFMQINFTLNQTDYLATIKIYDDQGRPVRQLLPNQILAPSSTLNWDGTLDDGSAARMGIYILWMQLLSPDGDKLVYKEPIVVARPLN